MLQIFSCRHNNGYTWKEGISAIRLTNACKAKNKRNIFFSKGNDERRW
jgi:hypothetical protein